MITFTASRLKIKRAKQHVTDLNRDILVFKRSNPYRIAVDRDSQPGEHLLRASKKVKPPEMWSVMIGDIFHNLHSALDILACDIMRAFGRTSVRNVYFPFCKSADSLDDTIKNRKVGKTRPYILNAFRALKPYEGGDLNLYAIHEFNLRDKHQLLIPVLNPVVFKGLKIYWPDGRLFLTGPENSIIMMMQESGIFIRVNARDNLKFEYNRKPPFEVLFYITPTRLEPIIPTLRQMTQLVEQIIAVFEGHLNDPQPPIALGYDP